MPADGSGEFRSFPTTHWSLVGGAAQTDTEARRRALGELLARYLPALRAHLVLRKRLPRELAEELLHDFLAYKVVEKELVARADRRKGKFRTFLLTALDRFVANRLRDAAAKKRRPQIGRIVSLHDQADPLDGGEDPAGTFERAWARQVLVHALARMQQECRATGRDHLWGLFECRLLAPTLDGARPLPYGELILRFNLGSPTQASNALITAKRMFARTLRSVVAEYVADPGEVDAEIVELRDILAGGGTCGA